MAFFTPIACALFATSCATAPLELAADNSAKTDPPELSSATTPPRAAGQALDPDVLYRVLLAEIAGQRGRMDVAVREYAAAAWASDDPQVAERATRIALFAKDYRVALRTAQRWLALAPEAADAQKNVGILHLRAGNPEAAAGVLSKWARSVADTPTERYELLTTLLLRENDRLAAMAVAQRVAAADADQAQAFLALSRLAAVAGDLDAAAAAAERTIALDTRNHQAKRLLARIRLQQGDNDTALALIGEAIAADPDDSELRMDYARMLLQANRHGEARQQFEILKEAFPGDADVLYALALLALEEREYEEAEVALLRLIELGERTEEAAYYLGGVAAERQDYAKAIEWYGSVDGGEFEVEAQIQVANVLAAKGDLAAARDRLQAQREDQPSLAPRLYLVEAEILRKEERGEEAMAMLDQAVGRFPDNTDLLYARALLGEQLDRPQVLERDLRRILELDAENAHALNALGYTLAERNERLDEAYELIARAYELRPDDAAIMDSMGWIHYRLGRLDEAERYLRRALAIDYDGEIAGHLGEVLWMQDRREDAERVWTEALERDPDNPALQEILQRFRP
jgi:tetratricopeptide (TPR) repeat protein